MKIFPILDRIHIKSKSSNGFMMLAAKFDDRYIISYCFSDSDFS